MRVTLKDIVEKTGVSKSVVSMYLNKDPRVRLSEEKKKRIDEAVRELGYRPSLAACALRKGRSRMLGLVLGGITDAYFSHLAEACLKYAEDRGYQLLFSLTSWDPEKERKCMENLIERQVDGIFYAPYLRPEPEFCRRILESRIPILLNRQKADGFLSANTVWDEAFEEMIAFFAGRGARKIACCIYPFDNRSMMGIFQEICARHRVEMVPLLIDAGNKETLYHALLAARPDGAFISDCRVVRLFLEWLRDQKCSYSPEIVTSYNFPVDLIDDPQVVGVVFEYFYPFVRDAVNLLIDNIESDGASVPREIGQIHRFYPMQDFMKEKESLIDTLEKAEKVEKK